MNEKIERKKKDFSIQVRDIIMQYGPSKKIYSRGFFIKENNSVVWS